MLSRGYDYKIKGSHYSYSKKIINEDGKEIASIPITIVRTTRRQRKNGTSLGSKKSHQGIRTLTDDIKVLISFDPEEKIFFAEVVSLPLCLTNNKDFELLISDYIPEAITLHIETMKENGQLEEDFKNPLKIHLYLDNSAIEELEKPTEKQIENKSLLKTDLLVTIR